MRENWKDVFLRGLEVESDVYRLGDIFKRNIASSVQVDARRGSAATQAAALFAPLPADDVPTLLSEVVVTSKRPDWLSRQVSRVRYGVRDLFNGRPASGEAYYGLPSVRPTTAKEQARHRQFLRERQAFHNQVQRQDHLQRNIDEARRDPVQYVGDVAIGTLKGGAQAALDMANAGLAASTQQNPYYPESAAAINQLTGRQIFGANGPWPFVAVQFAQPEWLEPDGDIQNQWGYLGRFGAAVGGGAATEVTAPSKFLPPMYRPTMPDGRYYSVAFEAKIPPSEMGRSHSVHVNRANGQLDDALMSDPEWALHMEDMIPGLQRSVSSIGTRRTPNRWVWHHDGEPRAPEPSLTQYGFIQLVPRVQHRSGSVFQGVLHPGGRGGYSTWAISAGAPKRR